MKKLLYSLFSFLVTVGAANAQNTFPATGNVGIGTASPNSKLHIADGAGGEQLRISRGNGTVRFVQETGLDNLYLYNKDASKMYMFWKENGYIGIGTITPSEKLEIKGSLRIVGPSDLTHSELQFYRGNGSKFASIGQSDLNTANSPFDIREFNGNDIRVVTSGGNERLRIRSSDGNVGIGTTAPGSYKLAVAGTIGAWGEVRVFTTGTPFPDYVFDPAYKLPNLEDTEKFVKKNRHLPEVPSAADIEKDGMSLNGMNTILLKKVEELTLYMIEMKKKTEELEKEIKELKENQKK
jgi:hypothetical protein